MDKKMKSKLQDDVRESLGILGVLAEDYYNLNNLEKAADACISSYRRGGKIMAIGNGGSAADAQHLAAELVSRFYFDRPALAAIALTTDTSILTAVANDYGYEDVFSRQVEAIGNSNDILIAISTSGNSPNILKGLSQAKQKKIFTIGLTGHSGGNMRALCDICICVPSDSTPRVQECHLILEHALCAEIERAMFGSREQK